MEMIMYRQYFTVYFASKEWDFQKVFPSFYVLFLSSHLTLTFK